jgi:branched-chain amino acid transport system ATP-binding protein
MLDVKGLRAGYGRIQALHGIDLGVRRGELVALVGANGAGKTTLLKVLSGIQGFSGSVKFEGEEIRHQPAEKRVALGIVHCPEGRQVFGPLSVEDNLRLGAYRRGRARSARSLERVYGLFPALAERRAQPAGTLSGGQQQMVALARVLLGPAKLLLVDEPTKGLAPRLVAEVGDVLARVAERTTVLLVEQNLPLVRRIADAAIVIDTGRVVHSSDAASLLADEALVNALLGVAGADIAPKQHIGTGGGQDR